MLSRIFSMIIQIKERIIDNIMHLFIDKVSVAVVSEIIS